MNSCLKKRIYKFSPGVVAIDAKHQDSLRGFYAGEEARAFSDFLQHEAITNMEDRDGVTYLIFDKSRGDKKPIAFYTLEATAIPYTSRTKYEPDEAEKFGKDYEECRCGIPSVEIKMFAVDQEYQDTWYESNGEEKPIAAWIIEFILSEIDNMSREVVGFYAVLLHSVPTAESFYLKNHFYYAEPYMEDFWGADNSLKVMYLPLRDLKIVYDE